MERFFQVKDRWGNGMAFWVVLILVMMLPIILTGLARVDLENDVTDWLPDDDPEAAVLAWFHDQFQRDSRLLVSWDSSTLFDPRVEEYAETLKEAVASGKDGPLAKGVKEVTTAQDLLKRMEENGIERPEAVRRLSGVLIGTGFANVRLTEAGMDRFERSRQLVTEAVAAAVGKEVRPLPPSSPRAPQKKPPGEAAAGSDLSAFEIPRHEFRLRWPGYSPRDPSFAAARSAALSVTEDGKPLVEDLFVAPGAPVAVAVSLTPYGDEHHRETLDAIRDAALACGVPADEVRMGGTPVGRDRLNRSGKQAVWNRDYPAWMFHKRSPLLLSALCGIVASFLMLRSLRLAVLVLTASIYTCLLVLAIVPLTGHTLNMVLVVLPNLLLVLTISGAIHLANYWKHCARSGVENPIARAAGMAARPCFLASATTAIGMASLLTAVLRPVRDFGIYSSIGCGISLAMILLGFPSLMALWPPRSGAELTGRAREERAWQQLANVLIARHRLVSLAGLGVFAFCLFGLKWFQTETKVIRYFPAHTRIVKDYEFLEESLSGVVPVETVLRFNSAAREQGTVLDRLELVRSIEKEIAQHPGISGALSLADFRPALDAPPRGATALEKIRYRRAAQRTEQGIFGDQADQASELATLARTPLNVLLRGRRVMVEAGDELWRIRAQSAVLSELDYDQLVGDLNEIAARHTAERAGVDHVVTGMVPLFLRTQEAVLQSLIKSFALAFGVIALIMMALLRSVRSGLLAMLPNLFPVGIVFGAVSWGGIPVDIGTMITASVALGIAVDGTLHLLTWFQEGLRSGLSRSDAVVAALRHCGPAMWQTSVAIAVGMLMLAGADLLLISRFGWLMAALIMAALVGDVILLPALLAGWLGRLIERGTARRENVNGQGLPETTESVTAIE